MVSSAPERPLWPVSLSRQFRLFVFRTASGWQGYGTDPPIEQFADFHRRVYEQIEEIWTKCLKLGVDVVLDFGCWRRQERDILRAKIAVIGAQARLYCVICPEDEVWRRIGQRNIDPNSPFISKETFEVLKQCYEPLNEDEERVEVVAS